MASSSSPTETTSSAAAVARSAPKLQTLNYVNVAAYLSNFLVVFGATQAGLPDNGTLSDKYQTLVTPAPYAFAIWGIIFTAELIFAISQVFPSYRSNELVAKGVGYSFALASFAQCAWTIAFGLEKMVLSLVCMLCILLPLLDILVKTSKTSTKIAKPVDYWMLKFPFQIHAAWIMAATLVNFNVVAVAYEASSMVQTTVGWVSLVVLFAVGIYAVVKKENYHRVWVVPCVGSWASFAIASELSNPRDMIAATFSGSVIATTKVASTVVAYMLLLVIAIELARKIFFGDKGENERVNTEGETGGETEGGYSSLN